MEIAALDDAPDDTVVLRACSAHGDTLLDGLEWAPVITEGPEFSYALWGDGQPKPLDVSYGTVGIALDVETGSNVWPKYSFEGRIATIWVGDTGAPFTAYEKIWTGKLGPIQRETDQSARFTLLGPEADLVRDLLSATYGGTGGPEGTTSLMGTYKPFAIGAVTNVSPVLIDPVHWIYQVSAYGECPVTAVYENAYSLGLPAISVGSYAELAALDLADGTWAIAPAVGMFRIANEPTGKITADAGTVATPGEVVRSLMLTAGLASARIDASVAATGGAYNIYVDDQISILDVIRDAAFGGGRFLIANGEGVFHLSPYDSTKAPLTLTSDQSSKPYVRPDSIVQEPVSLPAYRVRVGHTRVWSVHSSGEISPKLGEIAANQAALDAVAKAAQEAAELAAEEAKRSREEYEAMVKDGILDRVEKLALIERIQRYTAERPGILNEASNQRITTERTAYDDAYTALMAYLATLDPAWNDTSQNTTIEGATYLARLGGYDLAKEELRNAIAAASAKTAQWGNVEGDGKPEDGATVGAPPGTNVGDRPVEDVLDDIDSGKNIDKYLPSIILPILQKPIDEIGALTIGYGAGLQKAQQALHKKNLVAIRSLQTWVDEDGSKIAQDVLQLTSRVDDTEAALAGIDIEGSIEAGLKEVRETIANTEFALSQSIDTKIANYGKGVTAWMTEEERVRVEKDNALAEDIEQMGVRITTETGNVKTTLEGQFNDFRRIIINEDGSVSVVRQDEMGAAIKTAVDGVTTAYQGAIKTVEDARIEDNRVTTQRFEGLESSIAVTDANGNVTTIGSAIQTLRQAVADIDDDGTSAELISQLQSRLDNFNGTMGASLEQAMSTYANKVDGVGAQYTLKVQTDQNGQKYVAGMGVAIENGVSDVAFSTDSFRIVTPGANPRQVFYSDVNGVYMPEVRVDKLSVGAMDGEFLANKVAFNGIEGTQTLPGGVVMKWGKYRGFIADEATFTVNFQTPFPTACDSFVPTPYIASFNSNRDLWIQNIGEPTRFSATVGTQAATRNDQRIDGFDWIAFGR